MTIATAAGELETPYHGGPQIGQAVEMQTFLGEMMYCRWLVACDNKAIGIAPHPVLKAVPICERCAKLLGIKTSIRRCIICGADHNNQGEEVCSADCWNVWLRNTTHTKEYG